MSVLTEQQKELKIQKGIRQAEDGLVTAIQTALDDHERSSSDSDKLEESQFRNLVRVAETTESAEVIKNFLRYQVGRDRKWGRGQNSLATKIIHDIEQKIKNDAKSIAKEAKVDNFNSIWIDLIRRYLGYGARHLRYLREGQS
jgi:hypothetical protein